MDASEAQEKASGVLDRLTDFRGFVLFTTAALYVDILFIREGIDPRTLSLNSAISQLESLSLAALAVYCLSYSLVMAVIAPALRFSINLVVIHFSKQHSSREFNRESRVLAVWSTAVLGLSVVNLVTGWLCQSSGYHGLGIWLMQVLALDGFWPVAARLSVLGYLLLCIVCALYED